MSNIEIMLMEEYARSLRRIEAYKKMMEILPKGSIQFKKVSGKERPYLCFREMGKVKSKYIKDGELEDLLRQLEERKRCEKVIKSAKEDIKFIVKAVGKEKLNDYIAREGIY